MTNRSPNWPLCARCGENERRTYSAYCPDCHREVGREWNNKNRERRRELDRSWWKAHPQAKKDYHDKYRYGDAAPAVRARLLVEQRGLCGLCGDSIAGAGRRPSIDHDHVTGAVRSLLCMKCNTGLGSFRDSIELLAEAISYIARHNETQRAELSVYEEGSA